MPSHLTVRVGGRVGAVRAVAGAGDPTPVGAAPPDASAAAGAPDLDPRGAIEAEARQLAQARQALVAAAGEIGRLREGLLKEAEGQLADLAVAIARKVLAQEIQAGRYEIEPIVKEALAQVPDARDVVVRLHPADLARCQAAGQDQDQGADARVRFVADPDVPQAGCVIETPEGVLGSVVDGQLGEIGEALKAVE